MVRAQHRFPGWARPAKGRRPSGLPFRFATTWVAGKQTTHVELTLSFDPAAGFHDYRIEWSRRRVRFLVDGMLVQEWTAGVPRDAMYVMSNA